MTPAPRRPRVLVVAGHDPSGAGVDADRAALAGLEVEAVFVVTARTDQDDRGVRSIGAVDPRAWLAEALRATASTGTGTGASPHADTDADTNEAALLACDAVKFGLLPGAAHVEAACELIPALRTRRSASAGSTRPLDRSSSDPRASEATPTNRGLLDVDVSHAPSPDRARDGARTALVVVVDPVLAASSGGRFLDAAGVEALRRTLMREPDVILTPNVLELAELTGRDVRVLSRSVDARLAAGRELLAAGMRGLVLKGGHGEEDPVCDLVLERDRPPERIEHARVVGGKIRGSGCRFASRLAAELALGRTLGDAARRAADHVAERIERGGRAT